MENWIEPSLNLPVRVRWRLEINKPELLSFGQPCPKWLGNSRQFDPMLQERLMFPSLPGN